MEPCKCWYEYKKSINWSSLEKVYMWNPCVGDCEYDKKCDTGEYSNSWTCQEHVVDHLELKCEDGISNTTLTTPFFI